MCSRARWCRQWALRCLLRVRVPYGRWWTGDGVAYMQPGQITTNVFTLMCEGHVVGGGPHVTSVCLSKAHRHAQASCHAHQVQWIHRYVNP